MLIGFDASRAFVSERTGTENYSYYLLRELLQIERKNAYKIYLRIPENIRKASEFKIVAWLGTIRKDLPKTNNYQLILIENKRLWTQLGLAWELWKKPVDVLFVPAHTLPFWRRKSIKTVVTIHDLGYEYLPQYHQFPHKLWLNKSTEYAVKHADRLIAVSEGTKEDLISKLQANASKISVVYEGVNHPLTPSLERREDSTENFLSKHSITKPYLLFIGTIQPRKNLVRVIQAFAEVKKRVDTVSLVLAGKKGWLSDEIYAEPEKLGIAKDVHFLGHISESERLFLLQNAVCFVFPSLFEGFGLPIIEAQYAGLPVVTSDKKPMTEVGGSGCVYVNPESVESIVNGMVKVIEDRGLVASLKKKGLENVKRFSWRKAAEETLRVLESVRD